MRISLRYKAAILIGITEAIVLGILLFSNLRSTRLELEHQLTTQAAATAELIATSATHSLSTLNVTELQKLLLKVIDKHNIRYISIEDNNGNLLAEAGNKLGSKLRVAVSHSIYLVNQLSGKVNIEVSQIGTIAALNKITHENVYIVFLEMVLVAFISLSLGWYLTRNLKRLLKATQAVARGDFSADVTIRSNDEVGDLGKSFNEMSHQLQNNLQEIENSNKRFRDIADNTSDWLWESDAQGRYTYSSKQVESILGYRSEQVIGLLAFELMEAKDADRLNTIFKETTKEHAPFYGFEHQSARKGGGVVKLETNGTPIISEHNEIIGYRGITRDITRRKEDETRLLYLADYDLLTGLLSRHRFIEILDDEIQFAEYSDAPITILVVDLDDFKLINDTHGHVVGDSLLRTVADILTSQLGKNVTLARLGGDEFGILLPGHKDIQGKNIAKEVIKAVESTSLVAAGTGLRLSASIGISSYPECGNNSQSLLAHADSAVTQAKSMGHNRYYIYNTSDNLVASMRSQINWRTVTREALENNRLFLEFQPIIHVSPKKRVAHFEALVRLRNQDNVSINACDFVPAAEHTGQINQIDKWVLDKVLSVLTEPKNEHCSIAINVSGKSLNSPGFCEYVEKRVLETKVKSGSLSFEITESAAISELTKAESFILRMRNLGFQFSLDDFGVGFSSFSYLKHLPVDKIKIDGNFIRHLDKSREDKIFVNAINDVAHGLGLETVAEYVESQAILNILIDIGVDYVQGYHMGKPGPESMHSELSASDGSA